MTVRFFGTPRTSSPNNFIFRHQKRCCSDIVFVVVLLCDPNLFPQSSPKTMVFSHYFPEFSLGDPTPFLKGVGGGFFQKAPSASLISHLYGRCVGHDALTGMAGEKQALSAVFRILGEHLKNIFRSGIIDLRKDLVKEQGRLFVSVKH